MGGGLFGWSDIAPSQFPILTGFHLEHLTDFSFLYSFFARFTSKWLTLPVDVVDLDVDVEDAVDEEVPVEVVARTRRKNGELP